MHRASAVGATLEKLSQRLPFAHYFPALFVAVAVLLTAVFADRQRGDVALENQRAEVTEELGLLRAELEGKINGGIELGKGMVAVLATEPDMTPERFDELARHVFGDQHQFISIAAAPDMVVRMVYPLEPNRKVLGLDYRRNALQRGAAFWVAQSRKIGVTGPVDLVQGGKGLIVRYPVLIRQPGERDNLWGILSIVMDLANLYTNSGLMNDDLGVRVALARGDSGGRFGKAFFGDAAILDDDPVRMSISLGRETWMIAAVPREGWSRTPDDAWLGRGLMALLGLTLFLPLVWAGRLMAERKSNIRALESRGEQLRALSHRLEVALESSRIGIWEFDVEHGHLDWDARMYELYGLLNHSGEPTYALWRERLHPDDIARSEADFRKTLETGAVYASQFRIITPAGLIRHLRAIGSLYVDATGHRKLVGVNWNVTEDVTREQELAVAKAQSELKNDELEKAHHQMEFNALHDALTGLPNRRYLDQRMAEIAAEDERPPLTVLHIDLDRFKDINDTLGHAAGDEILRHAAKVLTDSVAAGDFVARIGGDEFVIVSLAEMGPTQFARLADRIIEDMNRPILFEGHECRAGASLGIAAEAGTGDGPEKLLINADLALYEAKRKGRNRHEFFTQQLRSQVFHVKQTADELLRGLERNEFYAWYQPQFDCRTLELTGVEALVRWDHPKKGIVAPNTFLRIAETLNVVHRLDGLVLKQALMNHNLWTAAGIDIPSISVNISAQRLHESQLMAELEALEFRPGTLRFELLESVSFDEHDEQLSETLGRIRDLGIDIEIDDFGTGHASIINLLRLTPRRLKIDRQLISPILTSSTERQLVSSIIDIGKTCGIEILAEGVETFDHVEMLRMMGCDALQGYAFARPMPASRIPAFVRERSWLKGAEQAARARDQRG